jgi:pyruvate,water dikinase
VTQAADGLISDPLNTTGDLTATFANVNSAEAWGGTAASPLGWTFFATGTELGMRRALVDFGALPRSKVNPPHDRNLRFLNIFYGRPGSNLALWGPVMDKIWGSSGAGYVQTYHAGKEASAPEGSNRGGSALSAAKFVVTAIRGRAQLARYGKKLLAWWELSVRPGSTVTIEEAKEKFREAAKYNLLTLRWHTQVSFTGQSLLERLKAKCAAAGLEGLELQLIASDDEFEEQGLIADMWAISRDKKSLEQFLARWGFQGPVVGELSSHSWREDPSPLMPIIEAYRAKSDEETPVTLKDRQRGARREVEQKLLAGRSFVDRTKTRILVHFARIYIPLRQTGRSTFLKTYDVARCMARRIGDQMVAEGVLTEQDDIFYLTDEELLGELPDNVKAVVQFRRERREYYKSVELPERWTGELTDDMVEHVVADESGQAREGERPRRIEGLGVSAGVAEGRAVVVTQPDAAYDLAPGDILVCNATDPSWAAIFYAVDALVTDIGAQMSHGAIVARELGIPAVVNTRTGTKDLRTGDRIRVDGTNGVVELLS